VPQKKKRAIWPGLSFPLLRKTDLKKKKTGKEGLKKK
jgi:hypothetical protein